MTNQKHFHHLTNLFETSADPEKAEKIRSYMKDNNVVRFTNKSLVHPKEKIISTSNYSI